MDTRSRILDKASVMFIRQGIRSITMDDISEEVGISKRTLYESFSNKEDLIRESIAYQYQQGISFREEMEQKYGKDPLEIIYQHFRFALMRLGEMHPNFMSDLQKYHSSLWKQHIEDKQQENIAYTCSLIERGIQRGIFRQETDAEILTRMIHSAMPLMVSKTLFPGIRYNSSDVFRQVFINFLRGMATLEGIALIDEKFK